MTKMNELLEEVRRERVYQKEKWGDDHDLSHDTEDWLVLIDQRLRTLHDQQGEITPIRRRVLFVTIAALAIAATEALEARESSNLPTIVRCTYCGAETDKGVAMPHDSDCIYLRATKTGWRDE